MTMKLTILCGHLLSNMRAHKRQVLPDVLHEIGGSRYVMQRQRLNHISKLRFHNIAAVSAVDREREKVFEKLRVEHSKDVDA